MMNISNPQPKQPLEDVDRYPIAIDGNITYGASASSLLIPTRKPKHTKHKYAYNYKYSKIYTNNTSLQQPTCKVMGGYIHTYNANDSETNNLCSISE